MAMNPSSDTPNPQDASPHVGSITPSVRPNVPSRLPPGARLPSIGFVLFVLIHVVAVGFLVWGFSTPRLDRVWTLHHQLKIGDVSKLDQKDHALLEGSLADHPTLARALISRGDIGVISANRDGWIETPFVTLVRTGDSKTTELLLNVETSPEHLPFKVELEGKTWKHVVEVTERKEYAVQLPPPSGKAEIIVANVKGKRFKNDPSILGIQIHFPGDDTWQEAEEGEDEDEEAEEQ
jgi:hypothetical protein